MKKTLLFLITGVLAITVAHAQSNWIDYKIDAKVSVKIPAAPRTIDDFNVMSTDSNKTVYVIGLVDLLKSEGTDSLTLITKSRTVEYANKMRDELVKSMPGFQLGQIVTGIWKDYTCYHMEGVYTPKNAKVYMFLFIVGSKLYSLTALVPENVSNQGKDAFYASAVVN